MPPKNTSKASPPTSPTKQSPQHSRDTSLSSRNQHVPLNPSHLRESHVVSSSPDTAMAGPAAGSSSHNAGPPKIADTLTQEPEFDEGSIRPANLTAANAGRETEGEDVTAEGVFSSQAEPNARTSLLSKNGQGHDRRAEGPARPDTARSYGSFMADPRDAGFVRGRYPGGMDRTDTAYTADVSEVQSIIGDPTTEGLLSGVNKTQAPTESFGILNRIFGEKAVYLRYYIPILNWLPQYKWDYLRGDLISALTMASFYVPMSLSYAANLGHIPPINGLYSFVLNPIIYSVLGTCPQMVVGPEAPGSLLTGEIVRENIKKGATDDDDGVRNAQIAGIVTFMAGAIIFVAGLLRLGFLDSVLSRPFLRGFISAIGVVIFVSQLIPELGLQVLASKLKVGHGTCLEQIIFLCEHVGESHGPTAAVSLGSFAIIMVCRELKKRLQPRYPVVVYFPDRFLIVVLSAVFAWRYDWDSWGVEILGPVKSNSAAFSIHWPFEYSHLKYVSDAVNTAFIIALLGFFESSVAAKSLGVPNDPNGAGIQNVHISANRELVALGVANVTGGLFMALPAFGGYGRSKVNASTGGRTPMASVFLSIFSLLSATLLVPYFYYIPKGVLSAMISVVAYSLVEEAPHDIQFFLRIRGWTELFLMLVIFIVTICWDIKRGIAIGIGLSLLRVVRHSTRPRIQILGRVPNTTDKFESAEANPDRLEFVEGSLIVKIPEPLTFANTGDLRNRLRRLEDHGKGDVHPAKPRRRNRDNNQNVIFDVHGVTSLDGAGAQVLFEIVQAYRDRGVRVFFCRLPCAKDSKDKLWNLFLASGIVDCCGGVGHFRDGVQEALHLAEVESLTEELGSVRGSASGSVVGSAVHSRMQSRQESVRSVR